MKHRKFRNRILIAINFLACLVALASMCAVDSDSYLPIVALAISATWLCLSAYANGRME